MKELDGEIRIRSDFIALSHPSKIVHNKSPIEWLCRKCENRWKQMIQPDMKCPYCNGMRAKCCTII